MHSITRPALPLVVLTALVSSNAAFAGGPVGTIAYAPAASIPAISDIGIIILSLLIAVISFRALRSSGRPLATLVAGAIGLLGIGAGTDALRSVQATSYDEVSLTASAGGSVTVNNLDIDVKVTNTTGTTQYIRSITATYIYAAITTPTGTPQCTVNMHLANDAYCFVRFTDTSPD